MKKSRFRILLLITLFLLLPVYGFAEEDAAVSGKASITARTVDGARQSAKFQEYSEIPDGVSGNVDLNYRAERYFFKLMTKDIAEDDQYLRFVSGLYGKFKLEVIYDKIPHRFAFDAKTLYSGMGSENLVLSDALQTELQNTGTDTVGDLDGNGTANQTADRNIALANRTRDFFTGASTLDVELFRKTGKVNLDVMALDPINFRVEFRREERDGARPFSGTFGFGHMEEVSEPIDYDTTDIRLIAEYAKRPFFVSGSYLISKFDNNNDTLKWDNPFRITDATSSNAYTQTFGSGPKMGLIDLAPSSLYHNLSLSGSMTDLPLRSSVSLTGSWGLMKQDDSLVPFTTNTAINAAAITAAGTDPNELPCTSQNASDPACVPHGKADLEVKTSLYNALLTSRPFDFMTARAKVRYYKRDNESEEFESPGYVRSDSTWEAVPVKTEPVSFNRLTAGLGLDFNVIRDTTLGVGYTYDKMERTHREASETKDDIYKVQVDNRSIDWLDLRASYELSRRDGEYDFTVPFELSIAEGGGVVDSTTVAQHPRLRKYDEADRDGDKIQLLASAYPIEPLTVSGSVVYDKNDYKNSSFGLLEDKRQIYSIDAGYELSERLSLNAFFSHEIFKDSQKGRQWSPNTSCVVDSDTSAGECTDPFLTVGASGPTGDTDWTAEHDDRTDTFGGGIKFAVIPSKLDLKLDYLYSKTDGKIDLSSPVGANIDVDQNILAPVDFEQVDDIKRHNINAKAVYTFTKNLSLALGYMWEKFRVEDFDNEGFTHIPLTTAGAFNGAIFMGTIPKDYDVNVVYTKLTYKFM